MFVALFLQVLTVATVAASPTYHVDEPKLLTDVSKISKYWGQLSPYHVNPDNRFGVKDVGVPDGCQIVQAHTLQRHAERFPTGMWDDGKNNDHFAEKVEHFVKSHPKARFTGPLEFLNQYEYLPTDDFLTGKGASTEFQLGVDFWNRFVPSKVSVSPD